jgi:hypothetical protein
MPSPEPTGGMQAPIDGLIGAGKPLKPKTTVPGAMTNASGIS